MTSHRDPHVISRRRFLSATAAGLSSLALAACGAGTSEAPAGATTGAEAGAAVPEASPTEAPTPTPVVLGTGNRKVTFWHGLGGPDGATLVKMLQQYSQEHPDVTISSETYAWDLLYQKLPTATAAGTPPHLAIFHSWAMQQFAAQGLLQDADTLFFGPGLIAKDDFNQGLLQTISADGKVLGIPFDNHGFLNFINTKIITDAGLDPKNLPKNGTEFIEWAQKIVVDESGKHPNEEGFAADRVKIWATHTGWQRYSVVSTIWQFGGGIISDDGKTSLLNDPKTIAAVQYWHDLIFKHHVVPAPVAGLPFEWDMFKDSLALMWNGGWQLNFFNDNPEAAEVMQPGYLNSFAPDGSQATRFDAHTMVVPMGVEGDDLEAAKDLIVWLSNNGATWATSGQVPARLSVQQQPDVQNIPVVKTAAAEFNEIGRNGPSHPAINEIVVAYETAISSALSGLMPADQAMNEAHTAVQSILDRG
ncbi:MAG TPA: extracellular solute-binding protein [Herpetosiphonaceae bacterium]